MKKSLFLSLKIMFYGIILPFKIWQFSKKKLIIKSNSNTISSMLDEDYIATSWLDLVFDSIIFILYPIGFISIIIVAIFTKISYFALLAFIPLYFITLILSFMRELGGSFMLLHMNVKKIRTQLEHSNANS